MMVDTTTMAVLMKIVALDPTAVDINVSGRRNGSSLEHLP